MHIRNVIIFSWKPPTTSWFVDNHDLTRDTFYVAGLASSAVKSDVIDSDHEEGTRSGSSKGKKPICDIREGTLQPHLRHQGGHPAAVLFQGEGAIYDNRERTKSHGKEHVCNK
ncbi:uncharacterized protein LOC119314747 [Triticum dicoccoides]|uniref:uncharacterized protein LOC119314747 n=1 Tax=Triticum dicoccoides TaxID=85692 RepID=UPI001890C12C|nr:uncharacterized protein LOC119314747 [Triticum dicoccoides]